MKHALASSLFTLLLLACAPDHVVLVEFGDASAEDAQLPDADVSDAAVDASRDKRCTSNAGCQANEFCAMAACNLPEGECEPRPSSCSNAFAEECGCDGVMYFNQCLRRKNGIAAATGHYLCEGTCGAPQDPACPTYAKCARLLRSRSDCATALQQSGSCYVAPDSCRDSSNSRVASCAFDVCVDPCNALKSGDIFYTTNRGCEPPRL